jgi:DNA-binding response OmpR family regulator
MKILVVMMPSAFRDELLFRLGQEGLEIHCSSNRSKVFKTLRQNKIDKIITQMNISDLDAIELILALRDLKLDIPIVVISFKGSSMKSKLIMTGKDVVFQYPPSIDTIMQNIKGEFKYEKEK